MGEVIGPWGEGLFIIVGGKVCVTIHVLNCVNAYKDASAFMMYTLNLAFESPHDTRYFM